MEKRSLHLDTYQWKALFNYMIRKGPIMKKALTIILISAIMMVGCHSKTLHFEKAKKTPKNFTEALTGNVNYQLIDDGKGGNYIVVHTSTDVEATMDTEGSIVNLRFDNGTGPKQQNIYYLTTG